MVGQCRTVMGVVVQPVLAQVVPEQSGRKAGAQLLAGMGEAPSGNDTADTAEGEQA